MAHSMRGLRRGSDAHRKAIRRCLTAVGVLAATAGLARATIYIRPPETSVADLRHQCPGEPPEAYCRTWIPTLEKLAGPHAGSPVAVALSDAYPGWTPHFIGGESLTGRVLVTTYDAHLCDPYILPPDWRSGDPLPQRFSSHCMHGAQLEMTFEPTPRDYEIRDLLLPGGDFYWLQFYVSQGGYCISEQSAGINSTVGPYYYDPEELEHISDVGHPEYWLFDAPQDGCRAHGDRCGGRCPEAMGEHWQYDFYTYLALGTPGGVPTGEIWLFEGVHWGYRAECIPGPGTFATVLIAAAVVALPRWRVRAG
ncbi:MAG: hypothetical protein IT436_02250 [Phycisphaerales bacterium]|nr:hypothetical protein [Phycisphaerales bacterium]